MLFMKTWYKKAWVYAIGAIVLVSLGVSALSSGVPDQARGASSAAAIQATQIAQSQIQATSVESQPTLSNRNNYTNVSGNTVHSPAYTSDNSVPAGATARCRDGTYSFSQHASGTCSHHSGVATWLQ